VVVVISGVINGKLRIFCTGDLDNLTESGLLTVNLKYLEFISGRGTSLLLGVV
jgi:hypothetical protein